MAVEKSRLSRVVGVVGRLEGVGHSLWTCIIAVNHKKRKFHKNLVSKIYIETVELSKVYFNVYGDNTHSLCQKSMQISVVSEPCSMIWSVQTNSKQFCRTSVTIDLLFRVLTTIFLMTELTCVLACCCCPPSCCEAALSSSLIPE